MKAIIAVDGERFLDLRPAIAAAVRDPGMFLGLPLFIAEASDPGLAKIRDMPGVLGVSTVSENLLGVLSGLDKAVLIGMGLNSDWNLGGVKVGEAYPLAPGEPLGLAAGPAICAGVVLAQAPKDSAAAPTRPGDPVNIGTRQLSASVVPVVAAGNHRRPGSPFESVSPWGEPPWVLCVGATDDREGEREAVYSGRGSIANPAIGPDLLAWGGLEWDPQVGTSFAAGHASHLVCLARAWLLQVAANIDRLAGRPFGVPLVGAGVIDQGFPPDPPVATPPWNALPVLATAQGALATVPASTADEVGSYFAGPTGALASRILVQAAAKATTPRPRPPLSAPSLNVQRLQAFLDGLSMRQLMNIVSASDSPQESPPDDVALFAPHTADRLRRMMMASMPIWQFNYITREVRVEHREWTVR